MSVNENVKETDVMGRNLKKMASIIDALTTCCDEISITCLVYVGTRSSSLGTSSFYEAVNCFKFPGASWGVNEMKA